MEGPAVCKGNLAIRVEDVHQESFVFLKRGGHDPDPAAYDEAEDPVAVELLHGRGVALGEAAEEAGHQGKMLLLRFFDPEESELCRRLDTETLADEEVCEKLQDFAFTLTIGVIAGTASSLYVAAPLLREDAAEAERIVAANSEAVDLQSRHAMLLGALADLEEDRSTGKLDDADYERLKADLSGKAVDVMKKMDELAARPAPPPPGPRPLSTGDETA